MLRAIVTSPINALLVLAPVSWVLAVAAHDSPWLFLTAAVSLIPLAGLIGLGTEQLACRSGPALGGFLNATFGNAAELIIAVVALNNHHVELVKASITGSIIGNLLLVLGLSFFVGGLGRKSQKFHRTAATNMAAMLFLAVVALVMPAVFDLALYGTLTAHPRAIDHLSFWSAIVLIGAYAGSLIYAFTVQRDLFRPGGEDRRHATLSMASAVALLAVGTLLTTIQAELLVGALEPALSRFGFTEIFVGVIVVALIGNAAEHYSAVSAAQRDEMTLAVEIAVGSSAQIALLVGPAVVLYSFAIGHPMTLLFNAFEIAAITLSVLAALIVVIDGESNWVEGLQLLAVYLILGLAFYFVPDPDEVRLDAIIDRMGELSDRLIAELVDAVRAQLRKEQGDRLRDVYLIGDIEKDTARACIERLRDLANDNGRPITLFINSAGGNVTDGLAIHDAVRHIISRGIETTIIVQGMAYSMGSIVLQAASDGRRLAFPHSWIMIHEPAKWAGWQSTSAAAQHLERLKQMQDQIYKILSSRSGKPLRQIIRDTKRTDFYLDAQSALDYGLIDAIVAGELPEPKPAPADAKDAPPLTVAPAPEVPAELAPAAKAPTDS